MSDKSSSGFSRRSFLRGSSIAAAATVIPAAGGPEAQAAQPREGEVIAAETTISLNVNGEDRLVRAEPRSILLDVLRYQLDLTGAKPVSSDGSSGASTVLIDGRPVMASTTLALAARGKRIETVESLGGDQSDAVPEAFVEHDATQCGFCTPGFVVAVRAFLNQHPNADEAQIRQSLNGNICRCGTYANVIQAAVSIVKGRS